LRQSLISLAQQIDFGQLANVLLEISEEATS